MNTKYINLNLLNSHVAWNEWKRYFHKYFWNGLSFISSLLCEESKICLNLHIFGRVFIHCFYRHREPAVFQGSKQLLLTDWKKKKKHSLKGSEGWKWKLRKCSLDTLYLLIPGYFGWTRLARACQGCHWYISSIRHCLTNQPMMSSPFHQLFG